MTQPGSESTNDRRSGLSPLVLALVSTLMIPLMFLVIGRLNQPIARHTQEMQAGIGETVSVIMRTFGVRGMKVAAGVL